MASLETGQCRCLHHLHVSRFYFRRERGLDLDYCNGQNRYDFGTDEGFYFPGCDPKHYDIKDVGLKAFRRAYVKAVFTENKRWLTEIEKYQMLVPGTRKDLRDAAKDLAVSFPAKKLSRRP